MRDFSILKVALTVKFNSATSQLLIRPIIMCDYLPLGTYLQLQWYTSLVSSGVFFSRQGSERDSRPVEL